MAEDIDFEQTTWLDGRGVGPAITAARGPNKWEAVLRALTVAVNAQDDRIGALESFSQNLAAYRYGQTADAGAPTLGGPLFYNRETSQLWVPGGDSWYQASLTAVTGVSGGGNAPTNFTAVVNNDNTVSVAWTLPTPPGGTSITAVTVREKFASPGGVSGMPLAGTATSNTRPAFSQASTREYYVTCTFSNGVESAESNHVTVYLPYGSTGAGGGGGTGGGSGSGTPASILGIGSSTFFSLDIGVAGGANVGHPMSELTAGFVQNPYYVATAAQNAVIMQSYANSGTTSGSSHARTEHRETTPSGAKAAWASNSGTHIMSGTTKITHLPADGESGGTPKPWTCFAQIHDADGDVVRLQVEDDGGHSLSGLRLQARTHSPNGNASTEVKTVLQSSYTVGSDISWKIEVINGTCNIYIGGVVKKTISLSGSGCYFKAGNYIQFSTASGDGQYAPSSYATLELRNLSVVHTPALT